MTQALIIDRDIRCKLYVKPEGTPVSIKLYIIISNTTGPKSYYTIPLILIFSLDYYGG
jgi:hypothetical protein